MIHQIRPAGPTILFDAIANTADYLHKSATEGDSIFVVSDGLDNASKTNLQEVKSKLLRYNIRAYLFFLGTRVAGDKRNQLESTLDLFRSSGGLVIGVRPLEWPVMSTSTAPCYAPGKAELGKIENDVRMVHLAMDNAYKLEFDLQPAPTERHELRVTLLNPDGTAATDKSAICPAAIEP